MEKHLLTAKRLCIDLCSGKEGFSQAFKDNYEVVTLDIEKKFKPTICADVRCLPFKENLEPDVLLASPPCQHFSVACWTFPRKGIMEAMQLAGACFEAVAYLKPKKWLIENPRGRLRQLTPKKPNMTIFYSDFDKDYPAQKPTDLWGNIPLSLVKHVRRPHPFEGITDPAERHHQWGRKYVQCLGKTPADRAKVPMGVSQAVLEGCDL